MKKILLTLFVVALTTDIATAQITQEHRYNGVGDVVRMSTGDYKYQLVSAVPGSPVRVTLYNLNHSIFRAISVPTLGPNFGAPYVQYVSDALFDTNPATIEYVAIYNVGTSGDEKRAIVYSETGAQLLSIDSTSYYVDVYNTSAGAKLVASRRVFSQTGVWQRETTRVFGLPGRLSLRAATPALPDVAGAYPNPTHETVALPYTLPTGGRGILRVYDATGRSVVSYQVDGHTDHLMLTARDLRPGVYLYRVETAAGITAGQRFTIE